MKKALSSVEKKTMLYGIQKDSYTFTTAARA